MTHLHCPHPLTPWVRPLSLSILLACTLTACGGGGGSSETTENSTTPTPPSDPLSAFKTQKLDWGTCKDSVSEVWQVVAKLQCASYQAPLDYAAPEKGNITLQAMRVPAMSAQRKGAIFFNPGGPGGDGLINGFALLYRIFTKKDGSPQIKTLQAQLLNSYDLLGFNPRGTGNGTGSQAPLTCASDADLLDVDSSSTSRNRPGNFEAMSTNQQLTAQACQTNALTPYISTDATARDMDLLRHLMGDSKISYLGYSYGTWLGAWYGRLFPERVDRMVLDSNGDLSANHLDFTEYQAIARDTLITDFLAPYAANYSAAYDLGNTADAVRTNLAALDPMVKKAFAWGTGMDFYSNTTTEASMNGLVAAKGLNQLLQALPGATHPQMTSAIAAHTFVPYYSIVSNYVVQQKAQTLWNIYQYLQSKASKIGQPSSQKVTEGSDGDGSNQAVLYSVTCNDSASLSRDLAYWKTLGDTIAQKAPFFGGDNPPTQTCMYWKPSGIQQPPLSALQGLDILMLQSQYDTATATPAAMKGFAALPKAHMIYVVNEYTHGVFPYGTDCVDVPVLHYLLGQSPSARHTNCQASGVAQPLNQKVSKSSGATTKPSESTEASQRSDLINEFKQYIGRSAAH